jgi:integrase/recombinase XerD
MVSYSVKLKHNVSRIQKDGRSSLYLLVIINRVSYPLPLNLKWPADLVNNKDGCIYPRKRKDPDFNDYQLIIDTELKKVNEIFKIYRIQDRALTMELFLDELQNMDRRQSFLAYMKDRIDTRYKQKEISAQTRKNATGTYKKLKSFRPDIPFYAVDKKFLQKFVHHLRLKGNASGTIWSRIKDLKTYLHMADEDGITVNKDFEKFSNPSPSSSLTYLEDEELNRLVTLFNANKLMETENQALRAFLFSCFTSLRISDVQLADWNWMQMGEELRFVPKKNKRFNKEVTVPISKLAKSFIQHRTGKFFYLPTDQEINRSLKDIAKKAGIKKRLTFHVARHTFASQYYKKYQNVVTLKEILGHSKIETTMIYVHINNQDKRVGMAIMEADYLKNPAMRQLIEANQNDFMF